MGWDGGPRGGLHAFFFLHEYSNAAFLTITFFIHVALVADFGALTLLLVKSHPCLI